MNQSLMGYKLLLTLWKSFKAIRAHWATNDIKVYFWIPWCGPLFVQSWRCYVIMEWRLRYPILEMRNFFLSIHMYWLFYSCKHILKQWELINYKIYNIYIVRNELLHTYTHIYWLDLKRTIYILLKVSHYIYIYIYIYEKTKISERYLPNFQFP